MPIVPVVIINHNLRLSYVLEHKQNTLCKFIHMQITKANGIFPFCATQEFIKVTNGITIERPFDLRISTNQKELNALFAVDAFNSFSTNVQIWFGYLGGEFDIFEDVAINAIIEPLPPELAFMNATPATKAWLGI